MARLILALMLFAALALAAAAAVRLVNSLRVQAPAPTLPEVTMPNAARRVSYVLLMLLLLGVTSGWVGPA